MPYSDPSYMTSDGAGALAGGLTITNAYVQAYKAGFEQAYQQSESKLQPYFEAETQNEEFQYFDRIGTAEAMTEDETRYGDNPNSEITHDRRRIGLKDYELGKYVDEKDLKRVLTDPMNAYTQALLASGKRKIDDIIIDKFFGEAYVGKSGGTTRTFVTGSTVENSTKITVGSESAGDITTAGAFEKSGVANTEGFTVGGDYDEVGSGLTLAKLRAARTTMLKLHAIDQDTIVNCFVSAKQLDDLLGIEEVVSSDFAVRKALAEGSVTTFLGFRFIHTERLPLSTGTDADERRVMVSIPKALKFSTSTALKGDVWRVPSKKNIPYVYFKLSAEASRMWGEVSGEIRCNES